jgi:hypothetical protein
LKHSRIVACRFLLVPLLALLSCYYSQAQPPPSTKRPNILPDCTVDQDPLKVSIDDTVIWNPPNSLHRYSLDFTNESPFAASSVAAGSSAKVIGTRKCNKATVSWLTSTPVCYFLYNPSKDHGNRCGDPGVRVVPPAVDFVFYFELGALLVLGTFAVWRIMVRKRA